LVLLEYLDDAYPKTEYPNAEPLLPEDAIGKAKARIWIDHVGKKIIPAFFTFIQAQEKKDQDAGRDKLLEALAKFTKAMAPSSSGPYFFGSQFTNTDIVLAPWALRFRSVMKKYRNFEIPTEGGEDNIWARFKTWGDAVLSRESVKATVSDEERYIQVYKRYAENVTQSEVAKATRAGKPLP
jgi:glutathione S-transferase